MAYRYPYNDEEVKEYKPARLQENRSLWKYYLFNLLTCSIYTLFFFMPFSFDLDKVAPKRDGTKTINFIFVFFISLFTCSIALLVWMHHITVRIEEALIKRDIKYKFGTNDFWTYEILGSFIGVGPFVFFYKLFKAMNLLCADYNKERGL